MTDVTISALPVAASIADADLVVVVEIGTPNVTKRATAAQMRSPLLPLTGGTLTGALTISSGGITSTTGKFTDTLTLDAGGGWSSSNVGKQALITTPAGSSNPALGIADKNGTNLWGIINTTGTLQLASMPAYSDGVTAPTVVATLTASAVTFNKAVTVSGGISGNTKVTGTLETTGALTVDAGGATITGNSKVTGTLESTSTVTVDAGGLVVTSGGATITGNSKVTGTLETTGALTVDAGGFAATGNSSVTGALTVSTAATSGNQVVNFSQFSQTTTAANAVFIQVRYGTSAASDAGGQATATFSPAFSASCYSAVGISSSTTGIVSRSSKSASSAVFNITDNTGTPVAGAFVEYIAIGA